MAAAASRSSANTQLFIGTLAVPVGLFGTLAKPGKEAVFDSAGPNGGALKFEMRGVAAPQTNVEQPDAPVFSDPLADDAAATRTDDSRGQFDHRVDPNPAIPAGGLVDGEFRRVLVEEGSGQVVESDQVRRGVRLEDGSFVDCTEQVDAIVERTKLDRIEVVKCIDSTQIRRERVIGSYYIGVAPQQGTVGPQRAGQMDPRTAPTLRLFYETLRRRREVAIVKYTTRSRQQLGVIAPHARTGTLVLLSLIFAEDFREPPAKAKAIQKVTVTEAQVAAMTALLAALHGTVDDLDVLRDDAIALREELRARALAGDMQAAVVEPLPVADEVPDLEAALAESVAAVRAGKI